MRAPIPISPSLRASVHDQKREREEKTNGSSPKKKSETALFVTGRMARAVCMQVGLGGVGWGDDVPGCLCVCSFACCKALPLFF